MMNETEWNDLLKKSAENSRKFRKEGVKPRGDEIGDIDKEPSQNDKDKQKKEA